MEDQCQQGRLNVDNNEFDVDNEAFGMSTKDDDLSMELVVERC